MTSDAPPSGRFEGSEHRFPVRVYFEDTDLSGVVYHANYLRYMERARSDMLRVAGIDQRAAFEGGQGVYAVRDVALRFAAPARLDDDLVVVSRLTAARPAACVIQQRVMKGDAMLVDASVEAVFVTPAGRPRRQPPQWLDIFTRLLSKGN
ncbi:tol-pal system-associated acyl-CoA thioesterase [Sphingomonas sp.]|uniref:tol-pal system-associated acyl-CoA thioesterase n=1 Tax=Sphingomonas sp. TaxID=28214 RepID=UPI002BBD2340|nr:tol-pal system-associated acyl-CoA thioesterase [Sphingomonas sp.]HTG37524.1 tol-pal system-associated acyl-CoA thioesterase [Sphingomonas sp.]